MDGFQVFLLVAAIVVVGLAVGYLMLIKQMFTENHLNYLSHHRIPELEADKKALREALQQLLVRYTPDNIAKASMVLEDTE